MREQIANRMCQIVIGLPLEYLGREAKIKWLEAADFVINTFVVKAEPEAHHVEIAGDTMTVNGVTFVTKI